MLPSHDAKFTADNGVISPTRNDGHKLYWIPFPHNIFCLPIQIDITQDGVPIAWYLAYRSFTGLPLTSMDIGNMVSAFSEKTSSSLILVLQIRSVFVFHGINFTCIFLASALNISSEICIQTLWNRLPYLISKENITLKYRGLLLIG